MGDYGLFVILYLFGRTLNGISIAVTSRGLSRRNGEEIPRLSADVYMVPEILRYIPSCMNGVHRSCDTEYAK